LSNAHLISWEILFYLISQKLSLYSCTKLLATFYIKENLNEICFHRPSIYIVLHASINLQ
jgi:hypothetical protein